MRMIALVLGVTAAVPPVARPTGGTSVAPPVVRIEMATIPGGTHQRLYGASRIRIDRFALDRDEVTRADFVSFVRTNPQWRRSKVDRRVADKSYLVDWRGDLDAGERFERPVTSVSWYAADAYCKARGKRLPTLDEWEFAGAASDVSRNAARQPAFIRRLIAVYAARALRAQQPASTGLRNVYGVRGLHDRAWEWTSNFKPETDAHDDHVGMNGHVHTMSCASSAIGAADPGNYPAFMRYAVRSGLERRSTMTTLGFRCAATLT